MNVVLHPFLDICSGGGQLGRAVGLALPSAGPVCYVEHETTACEVLAARIADGALHDAPIWTDLHTFDGGAWRGRVEGIVGGYPCQPFSVAGKRLGSDDPRHLWPRISIIIRDVQPQWCFFENVRGHVRLGLREVWADLRIMGYEVHAGIFSAAEVGAPHQRERLFILAYRAGGGFGVSGEPSERDGQPDGRSEHVDDAIGERGCGGNGGREDAIHAFPPGPTDAAAWRAILTDRPDLAPALTQSEVRGMANGVEPGMDLSRAAQLRITGNGVVPQVRRVLIQNALGRTGRRRTHRT